MWSRIVPTNSHSAKCFTNENSVKDKTRNRDALRLFAQQNKEPLNFFHTKNWHQNIKSKFMKDVEFRL